MGWPESLKYSYAQAQKHKTVKTVYEAIETAGGTPYTSIQKILDAEGPGVEVAVKIKGENKWLSQLGDVCYIGSEAEPIVQRLTSGPSTSPLTGETIEGTRGEIGFVIEKKTEQLGMVVSDGRATWWTTPTPCPAPAAPVRMRA